MTTKAIIIKKQNTGEYDQLVTCYAEEFGKLTAIAKSILKPNSIQALHLDNFNLVEFDLVVGSASWRMPIITGAQVVDSFMRIKNSLAKTAIAYFFAEAVDKMVFDNDKDKELWTFLVSFLGELNIDSGNLVTLFRQGQARLLDTLGYFPEADFCKTCSVGLDGDNFGAFNHVLGGIVCRHCFLSGYGGILISQSDFEILNVGNVQGVGNVGDEQFEQAKPRPTRRSDLTFRRSVLDGMFEYIYGNKFYSLELLNMIK